MEKFPPVLQPVTASGEFSRIPIGLEVLVGAAVGLLVVVVTVCALELLLLWFKVVPRTPPRTAPTIIKTATTTRIHRRRPWRNEFRGAGACTISFSGA
jgi:hypothetical protein